MFYELSHLALGNLIWSPIHAKMKMGGGILLWVWFWRKKPH